MEYGLASGPKLMLHSNQSKTEFRKIVQTNLFMPLWDGLNIFVVINKHFSNWAV